MTDPMKRPLQTHRIPRKYAVAPLIPDDLHVGWGGWDHYTVGPYAPTELTLAQALPTGVEYQTLDHFPDLSDWALAAFQAVGDVHGRCTSILAYRAADGKVYLMAYAEIHITKRIRIEFDTRLNDPYSIQERTEDDFEWGAKALAYHGIFVNVYEDRTLDVYEGIVEELKFTHGIDLFYRHDRKVNP